MHYIAIKPRRKLIARLLDWDQWITVHPHGKGVGANGEKKKGTPVLIDDTTGEVKAGMGGKFNGRHISAVPQHGANEDVGGQMVIRAKNGGHLQERYLGQGQMGLKGKYVAKVSPARNPTPDPTPEPTPEENAKELTRIKKQLDDWGKTHPSYEKPPYDLQIKRARLEEKTGNPDVKVIDGKFFAEKRDGYYYLVLPDDQQVFITPSQFRNPDDLREEIDKEKRRVTVFKNRMDAAIEASKTLTEARTIGDAEKESARLCGAKYVSFGNLDLNVANSVNEGLQVALKKFPGVAFQMSVFGSISALRSLSKKTIAEQLNNQEYRKQIEQKERESFENEFSKYGVDATRGGVYFDLVRNALGLTMDRYRLEYIPGEPLDELKKRAMELYVTRNIIRDVEGDLSWLPVDSGKAYAYASFKGVFISRAMRTTSSALDSQYKYDCSDGFHPKGTDDNAAIAIIVHEMMHKVADFIDGRMGERTKEFTDLYAKNKGEPIGKNISKYGRKNVAEMIAEAGCAAMVSRESVSPLALDVFKHVESAYKARVARLEAAYDYYGR